MTSTASILKKLKELFFAVLIAGAPMPYSPTAARQPQANADFFRLFFHAEGLCQKHLVGMVQEKPDDLKFVWLQSADAISSI
nr:hypothetical protein [Erwinia sp. Ejp617]